MSVLFAVLALIADPPPLRWGGDAEGGAPFVEADPRDPSKVRGFDVEVAEEIAKGLGRRCLRKHEGLQPRACKRRLDSCSEKLAGSCGFAVRRAKSRGSAHASDALA